MDNQPNVIEKERIIEREIPVKVIEEKRVEVEKKVVKTISSGFKITEEKKNIAQALVDFNSEMEAVAQKSVNPFFRSKYTNLSDIIEATRPILAKNGLSVLQSTMGDELGNIGIKTTILHTSGEYITQDGILVKPEDRSVQKIAGLITYLKRYELSALLYVSSRDEDTDGESEMNRPQTQPKATTTPTRPVVGRRV